ncbi:CPBP family intramembrane glutamic endopeptidase [Oceanobacillus iheyensis]|uniref:CPBP family intramembrane glutamic endopeptidase n=1 Tax=Oceanobacillus iheyensis TaxID=182710 RepID=UPI003633EFB9
MLFLALAIVTPILEEIIFRRGIFQTLENIFNTPIALIGSSAIFMLAHSFTRLILPGIFVMGLILGYLYKKHRSIYAPIILHMFINGVNVITVNFL